MFGVLSLLALIGIGPASALAVGLSVDGVCGTYPGRVVDEIARHQQFVQQRIRQGFRPLSSIASAAVDVGHIAVLPDDGTLMMSANPFDLDGRSLMLTPEAGVFSVQAGPGQFDSSAAEQGILLNPSPASNPENIGDDGTREVSLGFPFPFFGEGYTSVFINSDGSLTFQQGDMSHSARTLARVLSGPPPRITPYFADLDPSVGGQLTYLSLDIRFVVTWSSVPDYAEFGVEPRETVQVELFPNGLIRFSYHGINGREAVVGVSPGNFSGTPALVDLSEAAGQAASAGAVAENFSLSTHLDLLAVARRFYETHDDAYEFLVVFTTFDFDLDGAFAFEVNIANDVTGIGPLGDPAVFDSASNFGSSRLESFLNMGNLQKYPSDPETMFLRSVDSTLNLLGQEAGHRFLTYARWDDPEGSEPSTTLLGRDLQHWSFFFNTDASVLEGNRIRDNGDGTFTTTGAVERYSDLDQYLMGLLPPEEVTGSFLVKDSISAFTASRAPQLNANFSGRRANVTIDQIISANGPRIPNAVVAPKNFNFAFLLVVPRNTTPSTEQVAKLDRIRQGWEQFFARATGFRGTAGTGLVRGLSWTTSPLGLLAGTEVQAQVELLAAAASDVTVSLVSSNPSAVALPASVVIPAASRSALVKVTGVSPGRASVSAAAPGFETSTAVVEVLAGLEANGLSLSIENGDQQIGSPEGKLPQPLSVIFRDDNQIPFSGVRVEFAVSEGDASLTHPSATTDAEGRASTDATLGPTTGPISVTATVPGTAYSVKFSLFAVGTVEVPPDGVVGGASFLSGAVSPGSIVSIFGVNLAAREAGAASLPLPTQLAGASVEIGGRPAPLYYVSPGQINAQVPVELSSTEASVVVRNGGSTSASVTDFLRPAGPGIFTQDSSGSGPESITHASTNLLVTADLPASPGEFVQIYATGMGRVSPVVPSGQPAAEFPLSRTLSEVSVTMNGVPAEVTFSGLAPGLTGLYQVNARVPEGVQGTVAIAASVDGISSNVVTMEVR